jgi:type IV pilus assembly protein PilM
MVGWLTQRRSGPIGVDVGSRSIKLMQLSADRERVIEAARWDLATDESGNDEDPYLRAASAIAQIRQGRNFRGRDAVFCIRSDDLFVQNIRVPHASGAELDRAVCTEAANRLPFPGEEAEVRYLETADVRQGEAMRREVILMACHRSKIRRILSLAQEAGLRPVAIDVEPAALLRCYAKQFRREQDQQRRVMFVNVGAASTRVVVAQGTRAMFVKYIAVGGSHLDRAVAGRLKMDLADAAALRRHNGDRRVDQRDPEITRSLGESIRPPLERLAGQLSMCLRYYSVTFRGQPLQRLVLGGGEADDTMVDWLGKRLNLPCELGDPLRSFNKPFPAGRTGQWDVAAGLALREMN